MPPSRQLPDTSQPFLPPSLTLALAPVATQRNAPHRSTHPAMSSTILRIHGTTLPPQQVLKFALKRLYGIQEYQANRLCSLAGVNPMARIASLTHSYAVIQRVVETCIPSKTQAHRDLASVMQVLIKKNHYRAMRHRYAVSVRGAKTYNGETQRKLAVVRAKQFSYPLAPARRIK